VRSRNISQREANAQGIPALRAFMYTAFLEKVFDHYERHRRDLPWRTEVTPYRVLVSEFMLQQTQVERVQGCFQSFVDAFPSIEALAGADLKEVLVRWRGLGYNRRALNVWRTAGVVVSRHGGVIPADRQTLETLPGIGPSTSGAVCAFAYGIPVAFIETNIRRAFIHHFFPDRTDVRDREILPLVEKTLDRENPRDWYYALMYYGAMLRKHAHNPNRRSAHYTRQAPFEGSNRQARGRVIKALLERGPMTKKELAALVGIERNRLETVLSCLEQEGFLAVTGQGVRLS